MPKKAKEFLPTFRLVPDWHLSAEAEHEIEELVDQAQAARGIAVGGSRSLDRILFPNQIEQSVRHYLSRKAFGQGLPVLRAKVRKLSDALEKLLQIMPADRHSEIARQLRSLYCFDDPNPDDTHTLHSARETEWDAEFAPGIVRAKLAAWRDELKRLDDTIPRKRTHDPARDSMIAGLAGAWRSQGLKPGNSRAKGFQSGYFSKLVRIVFKDIEEPETGLDAAIRRVLEGEILDEDSAG